MQFHILEAKGDLKSGEYCKSSGRHLFAQGAYLDDTFPNMTKL